MTDFLGLPPRACADWRWGGNEEVCRIFCVEGLAEALCGGRRRWLACGCCGGTGHSRRDDAASQKIVTGRRKRKQLDFDEALLMVDGGSGAHAADAPQHCVKNCA